MSIFKVGDNVVTTRNVLTGKGHVNTGSTGVIVEIKDNPANPWIVVQMDTVKGAWLVGELLSFREYGLSIISTFPNKDVKEPDEKELRRRRDKQLGRMLGF